MSVFSAIANGIKKAAQAVYHVAAKLFGEQEIKDFGKAAEGVLKSALGKIATEVVAELSQQAIDGLQKRDIAFTKISAAAKDAGLQASNSIIFLLIELAVSALKGNFPVE